MVRAVFDTNILVDFLRGLPQAKAELALYRSPAISVMSWMEVMAGTTPQTESAARAFLQSFDLLQIDAKTAERAVLIRKTRRIKLPDAVIWATSEVHQCLLVTRNTRDFDPNEPGVRVPYTL
ncbi:MAG: type II toxin-antitoxin system VapC family toxin [Terracidiphilus sp.]